MNEDNVTQNPEQATGTPKPDLGKFKSVDALVSAYSELEAEFTRRSQRLKALEEKLSSQGSGERAQNADTVPANDVAGAEHDGVHEPLPKETGLWKGVPLMGGEGAGIPAPAVKPVSFTEAGALALGYLRKQKI